MDSKYRFGVIRVKASLMDVDGKEMTVYKRFGGVLGDTISRISLIPDDIQAVGTALCHDDSFRIYE